MSCDDSRQAEFLSLILSELSRCPQVANFMFEFGKPPDRLGLYVRKASRAGKSTCWLRRGSKGEQNNGRCRDCCER